MKPIDVYPRESFLMPILKNDINDDYLLRTDELALILNVSIKTIRNWRYTKKIKAVKVGNRLVRYRWGDVVEWVNKASHDSEAG